MKQFTSAILMGILWIVWALILEINGRLQGFAKWIIIIFPILWFITEAYFCDKYRELLGRLFNLYERRITKLEKNIK